MRRRERTIRPSQAAWIAVSLPLVTVPWLFPAGSTAAWWGVPIWTIFSLAATALLAVSIAGWTSRWWDSLADRAEAISDASSVPEPGAGEDG